MDDGPGRAAYRRLAFFFFATFVAVFFPTVFSPADDLVRLAGLFDFLAVFLAVFFGAFAALAILFAALLTGLGSRLATAFLAFLAAAFYGRLSKGAGSFSC
jgi:hypothetical protein